VGPENAFNFCFYAAIIALGQSGFVQLIRFNLNMLLRISVLLCLVAAVALLFVMAGGVWHMLPIGFERTVYGAFAFWSGSAISLLAVVLSLVSLFKNGRTGSAVRVCIFSVVLFGAFGLTYLYLMFSA